MALLVSVLLCHGAAGASDLAIAGRTLKVGNGDAIRFVAKDAAGFPVPAPGSSADPTIAGARLAVFDTVTGTAGTLTRLLPASGWSGLGTPAGARGYRYRGSRAVPSDATCSSVLVTQRVIKAVCSGSAISLTPPFSGGAAIQLTSGDGTNRYCAEFGGAVRRNDARGFRATDAPAPAACAAPRPNILLVNLDDSRFDGIDRMPSLQALADQGVSFSESFAPNAVCCPSRASLLSGLYSVRHGTRTVAGVIGGAHIFRERGTDQQTLAVWLHDAGYRTGLFGKYLNDYSGGEETAGPGGSFYIPPGWDRWRAFVSPEHYGGIHGVTYEIVDEAGTRAVYSDHTTDAQYSTDVLGGWVRDFVAEAVNSGRPFFAYWVPYSSHGDSIAPAPADRHFGTLSGLPLWRPPSWNEADISDKPRWVGAQLPDPFGGGFTDGVRELAYESLLSTDEQMQAILDQLEALGIADDTVVVVTSDNGTMWGEHRMWGQRKGCPYEECQRVPLIARYPRGGTGPATNVEAPVLNLDLAPTLADLAGVSVPVPIDGGSFASWLRGGMAPPLRADYLIEHWRQSRNDYIVAANQVSDGDRVRVYYGDPRAQPRSRLVFEFDNGGGVSGGALAVPIGADVATSLVNLGFAIASNVPNTTYLYLSANKQLSITDHSANYDGVYLWVEVDQGGVLTPANVPPDYFGVRDVAAGYTYVENEIGEVELYDLDADPWQLDNKADDPAYAALRATMAARLQQLLP